jgi:glycosyltransferase involved in cell wall biosynthesis
LTILHVVGDLFSKGGTPRKLLSLVSGSDKEHFRHIFLVYSNRSDNLNSKIREAGGFVIEVNRLHNYDLRLFWDIIRTIRSYEADIISTHFARADIYGTLAGILMKKPVIKNVHGILWNSSKWLQNIDSKLSRFRVVTVCNSRATLQAVQQQTGLCNGMVIYNGVPDQSVKLSGKQVAELREEIGVPEEAFVIGHVGGLIPLRDQGVIIDALSILIRKIEKSYLVLVGDGPMRHKLELQATTLGLTDRVLFLGYRDDVPQLTQIFDVYVNMATAEGFGISVVEAMQAGLSVVLANAGALPELIEDGVSGLLVPRGDSASLAKVLMQLEKDRQRAAQLGDSAKLRAASEFSIERYAREFELLYRDVTTKRSV